MLTDAQYRALKAWPESGGYVVGVSQATCRRLLTLGLFEIVHYSGGYYKKHEPDCSNAIREYEEAHKDDIK